MVYLIEIMSVISLIFNYLIYKRVNATYMVGTLEELAPSAYYCCCSKDVHLEPSYELSTEGSSPTVTEPMVQETYQAWTNRKEIPWIPPTPVPEPIKTPNREPLARPDGFV